MFEFLLLLSIAVAVGSQMLPEAEKAEDEPPDSQVINLQMTRANTSWQFHKKEQPCWKSSSRAAAYFKNRIETY